MLKKTPHVSHHYFPDVRTQKMLQNDSFDVSLAWSDSAARESARFPDENWTK